VTDFDDLADRLDAIADEIAEASITELKAALRKGEQKRPQLERTLSQAKRSIDKAAHLLRRAATGDDAAGDDGSDVPD
jgi:septal ring factor EnvC (AmiA/AmiB activator)